MTLVVQRESFVHCLRHWEQTTPEAIWLTQPLPDGGVITFTWREAAHDIRRIAAHLQSLHLPAGSAIALIGKNSAHWILADLAIMMAGHVSVPIYFTVNADTLAYILAHSEARLLMIGKLDGKSDSWHDMKHGIPEGLPTITLPFAPSVQGSVPWQDLLVGQEPLTDSDIAEIEPDSLATLIYTSGSTGRPKGVMHSHRNLVTAAHFSQQIFQTTRHDRMLSYLPLAHAAERCIVEATSLYTGCRLYFSGSLETFLTDLRRARPTLFFSIPRLWIKFRQGINQKLSPERQQLLFGLPLLSHLVKRRILQMLGLDSVRIALTGSAPVPPEVVAWYRGLGLELLEGYGMSENFGYSHANRPGRVRTGYVGECCPQVECHIDSNGEVLVKSPCTMTGYFKDPQKTAEDLTADGFLRTGDIGEIDGQGRLRLTGRVKDLFKISKGKYVAPVPIEQKLGNHPNVEVVCVAGSGQPQPLGLLLLAEGVRAALARGELKRQDLQAELETLIQTTNATLEAHEKLQSLVVIKEPWTAENGLLTPTLKIKRPAIEARYDTWLATWGRLGPQVIWE